MKFSSFPLLTLTRPREKSIFSLPPRLSLYLVDVFLLGAGLLGAFLPVGWTRDLKRIKQAPLYAWLGSGYFLAFALAAWWILRSAPQGRKAHPRAENYRRRWLPLVLLVLLPNLVNIWLRSTATNPDGSLLFGRDADIGLFFKYGHQAAQGQYPTNFQGQYMEYPQFALFFFWLGERLSGGLLENFYWVFPLILLLFQLLAALALYAIGRHLQREAGGYLLAAFTAGCPGLFNLYYTRFDVIPAALLLVTVYFFLQSGPWASKDPKEPQSRLHSSLAGFFNTAGTLAKWLPAVISPWLGLAYFQARRYRQLASFAVVSLVGLAAVLGPFYLLNPEAFWYPYRFQGSRKLIGESFWFLLQQNFLDPEHITPDKPWGEPSRVLLGNNKLLAAQVGLTLGVLGLSFWKLAWQVRGKPLDWAGWASSGLVGVAVFTLANRIFSPQYVILIAWVLAAAFLLKPIPSGNFILFLALISIVVVSNFQVYLLGVYPEEWVRDSWFLFGAGGLLCAWLLWRALKTPSGQEEPEPVSLRL